MILSLLIHNYYEICYRNIGWNHGTNLVKRDLHSLNNHSELISNNTFLLLYNFEGSSGFCNAMIRSYFDIKDIEVYRFEDSVKDVFTDMINSPIGKAIYNPNMPDVNLIMSCNDNVNGSELTSHANILLNSIVNDYKKIKLDENISIKEESIVINRLNDSMTKFRNVLSNCITSL